MLFRLDVYRHVYRPRMSGTSAPGMLVSNSYRVYDHLRLRSCGPVRGTPGAPSMRSFPSGLSFSRMMTTSQGGRAGDVNGSVASELTDA